jgi:hypothetical protein
MDQSHLDKMPQPGWSNRAGGQSPFTRNADGTVPDHAVVSVDASHVASVQPTPDAPTHVASVQPNTDAPVSTVHAQDEPAKL